MIKFFEIRDRATFIPVYAFCARPGTPDSEAEKYLLARAGYGTPGDTECIIVGRLDCYGAHYDPYDWVSGGRTMTVAHQHIEKHFDELETGDVIDVEFILGEKPQKKLSERLPQTGEI